LGGSFSNTNLQSDADKSEQYPERLLTDLFQPGSFISPFREAYDQ
jgi:hypothetical protein